jgi:16S rRNA G966 N2-methylase RsmD
MRRDARRYDVVFLDPPFARDDWPQLLALAAARLAEDGRLYAEARGPIGPVAGLDLLRRDKAGRVHYHLFASAGP